MIQTNKMKMSKKPSGKFEKPEVIIPADMAVSPEPHEMSAAWILAHHFETTVEFLKPLTAYMRKTPDLKMNGKFWEMKSPKGKSKNTIENQIRRAVHQSDNIVIDASRFPFSDTVIKNRIRHELKKGRTVKSLLFIAKDGTVTEMLDKTLDK